jgi:hypothetical protein
MWREQERKAGKNGVTSGLAPAYSAVSGIVFSWVQGGNKAALAVPTLKFDFLLSPIVRSRLQWHEIRLGFL